METAGFRQAVRMRAIQVAACVLAVLATGCLAPKGTDYSNPAVSVQTARVLDIQQHRPVLVNSFSNQERLAAGIKNLTSRPQVLQVEFVRQDSGVAIWKTAVTVPSARLYFAGPTAPLPAGNYIVRVTGTGIQPVIHSFTVYGY
jgi:hypothetical protein